MNLRTCVFPCAGFGTRFPDAIVERKDNRGKWRRLNVEFERYSSGFECHLPQCKDKECHAIICWEDNWKHSRKKAFEVIELKAELEKML